MKYTTKLQRIICFLFLLSNISLYAQNDIISLKKQIQQSIDNERAKIYNDIAYEYFDTNPDSSFIYASKALKAAQNEKNDKELARALFSMGYGYELKGSYFDALDAYMNSLNIYYQLEDASGIASLTSYIGSLYKMTGDYPVALNYFSTSLDFYSRLGDKQGMAFAWNNIGVTLYWSGATDRAKSCYINAINLFREANDSISVASAYNNLGLVAMNEGKTLEAIELFEAALSCSIEINYQEGIATSYSNIGDVYEQSGDYETALQYYKLALENPALEFQYSRKANNFLKMADIYFKQGHERLALDYYMQAKGLANAHRLRPQLMNIYFSLSLFYDQKQDYKNALLYFREYSSLKDSLFSVQMAEQLSKSNVRLEIYEKEQENQDLVQLNRIKEIESKQFRLINIILIIAAILFLTLLIILYSRLRKINFQNTLLIEKQEEIEKSNAELNILKEKLSKNVYERTKQLEIEIEKRREAEKNLDKSLKEVQRLNNFKSKLLNNLNQELRNTLNSVLGFSGLIEEELAITNESPKLLEYNRIVFEHSKQLYHSIQSILSLQVIERSNLNKLQLSFFANPFFNKLFQHMQSLYPNIRIEINNRLDEQTSLYTDMELLNKLISDLIRFSHEWDCQEVFISILEKSEKFIELEITIESNELLDTHLKKFKDVSSLRLEEQLLSLEDMRLLPYIIVVALANEADIPFETFSEPEDLTFQFSIPIFETVQIQNMVESRKKSGCRFLLLDSMDRISGILIEKYTEPFGTIQNDNSLKFSDQQVVELSQHYDIIIVDINPASTAKYASLVKKWNALMGQTKIPIFGLSAYLFPEDNQLLIEAGFTECLNKPINKDLFQNMISKYLPLLTD